MQVERIAEPHRPQYDPGCYLCPGNPRASGALTNPKYDRTFVFTNDFPALLERPASGKAHRLCTLRH